MVDNLVGQRLSSGDLHHQSRPVTPVQAIKHKQADPGLANPGRLELGAEGYDEQNGQPAHLLDCEIEQLARGRIDPMRILENDQHWFLARQALKLPNQGLQCPLLP